MDDRIAMNRRRNSESNSSAGSYNDVEKFSEFESLFIRSKDDKFKNKFVEQGAIPKSYKPGYKTHDGFHEPNKYKWVKKEKSDSRFDGRRSTSMHSLNFESEESVKKNYQRKNTLPFYYIVPENPRHVKILPPGTYLVIPQYMICNKPLSVFKHPEQLGGENERETDESSERGGKESKGVGKNWRNRGGGRGGRTEPSSQSWRKQEPKGKCKNEKPEPCVVGAGNESAQGEEECASKVKEELSNESKTTEEALVLPKAEFSGSQLSDSELAYLMTQLPYFDENYLKREWERREAGLTSDLFVKELKERRINEVYVRIYSELPNVSPGGLLEKISEIMVSDEAVADFIEMEKLKAREEVFIKLKDQFMDFSEEDIMRSYNRFLGTHVTDDGSDLFDFVRNDLIVSREEEKKMLHLQMISTMLPDIDADYVLYRLTGIGVDEGDIGGLNRLIEELLENPNYPKAAEFDPKAREKQKLWNYYVTNYSVSNYLQKVPDPEQFLSGSSTTDRKIERDVALEFLAKRYPDLDNFQLFDAFTNSDESIVKTCEVLDRNYLPERSIDEGLKGQPFSEAFLKEITFVVHKDEILKELRDEKERREIEIQQAEEENSYFECLLCYDPTVIPSEAEVCPDGHITCKNCLIKYIEMSFAEGKYLFPCLNGTCDTEYRTKTIEKLVKPEIFAKITQRRAAEEVDKAAVPGLEKCPSCDFAYVPPPEDKIFTCLNTECMRVTCRLCKEPNHIPLSCNEIEKPIDLQARQQVEEAMTQKLIRSCPNCGKKFIKVDGCNKIACSCGTLMCYICSEIVKDYSHFNGMGGSEFHKCPLYSDNRKLHVVDVLEAGIREKERVKKENPNVNFLYDPTETDIDNSK